MHLLVVFLIMDHQCMAMNHLKFLKKKKFSKTSNIEGQSVQREMNSSTRTDGQRVKQLDTGKQTVAFRNSAKAPKM